VPVPDGAVEAYEHKLRTVGGSILASDNADGEPVRLRLYDVLAGKDVWRQEFPAKSVVSASVDPHLVAVLTPTGEATVIDVAARRALAKLRLEPKAVTGLSSATLLRDRTNFYLALVRQAEPNTGDESPVSLFQGELSSVALNGRLYAFARDTGKLRWYHDMPGQTILLDRFDELPLVLCAATVRKPGPMEPIQQVQHFRSIDKATGKTIFNTPEDVQKLTEPFHTLRVDPWTGAIDLISEDLQLRHAPK
jgi:hypothetical protein